MLYNILPYIGNIVTQGANQGQIIPYAGNMPEYIVPVYAVDFIRLDIECQDIDITLQKNNILLDLEYAPIDLVLGGSNGTEH